MPRDYEDRREERRLSSLSVGNTTIYCRIRIRKKDYIPLKKGRTLKISATDDDGSTIELYCFNRDYLDKTVQINDEYYITATVSKERGVYRSGAFEIKKRAEELGFGRILPVYPLSGKLTQKAVRAAVDYALNSLSPIEDELPYDFYERLNLMHHALAYNRLHHPHSMIEVSLAKRTLAFTELFYLELENSRAHHHERKKSSVITPLEKKLIKELPFSLTGDQKTVLDEIRADLDSSEPMSRLLEGDVGSGKTLVAWISALHAIEKGGQVAFMAPTELLAKQHADGASDLLSKLGIRIAFLSGNVKGQPRRLLLQSLKNGDIDLIIGTHALFSEDVEFRNLTLAIIDEQHRFGIRQREALAEKGHKPSVLYMTATPIPRSLALTMLADYDISTLKTMPSGRIPIKTHTIFQESTRKAMYETIGVEFQRGHQAYFVYPRIDDEGDGNLLDVTTMYSKLKEIYPEVPSALIHSKLPEEEKMQILNDFRNKKIMYLVATSVVEVGIDVPDATCMVIEHAERFGLAALHQLRGRVGRSSLPSYCFLVAIGNLTEDARQRLKIMKETNDGFLIADKDLEIRGPGDIGDGERQSGFIALKFSSIATDLRLVEAVRAECERILNEDRGLLKAENAPLRNISQKR